MVKLLIEFTVFLGLYFCLKVYPAPMHVFLQPLSESVCDKPLEISVYVLNEEGNIDFSYEGKKNVKIQVDEPGGNVKNSWRPLPAYLEFKKGKSSFLINDSEAENLNIKVSLDGVPVYGYVTLSLKDTAPPAVESIMVEKKNIIILKFSEVIEEESALAGGNYRAVTNKREVAPEKIEYHKDFVVLQFPVEFDSDEKGYIELEAIKDLSGNELSSGTRSPDFKGDCGC